ncbi:hypothetical protein GCM10009092_15070 [Bowmanella denitrificans]|uniref:VWA domain-containing protein n=1 Tax=Bowmanella denitrificans TaxID=366582 RepID=A0ABP3GTR2_9ALTE
MSRKGRRQASNFSLAFLDVMSCGFGAAALLFLLLKHGIDENREQVEMMDESEVRLLEEEIRIGKEDLVRARNVLSEVDMELANAQGLARQIEEQLRNQRSHLDVLDPEQWDEEIKKLKEQLAALEKEKQQLLAEQREGENVQKFVGMGDRQYLTGLRLGGERILILLDASTSMLDERLVNIVRRRHMQEDIQRASPKWLRAQDRAAWLVSQFPKDSHYQIYLFNTDAHAAIENTQGSWLKVSDKDSLDKAMASVRKHLPGGGTSLERAFLSAGALDPLPDNIFLITDGLPTQGLNANKENTISGIERLELFKKAVQGLPQGVPVNTLLSPMEGDPMAAAAFWQLAQLTGGSFLSPSEDWP